MPNKPRPDNPARVVRMDDALWARVKQLAEVEDDTPSAVVRRAVEFYLLQSGH